MNTKLFEIAATLHALHSAQGRHVSRILALSDQTGEAKAGRVTNSKPTKKDPGKPTGATVSRRDFIADAQSSKEERKTQTRYFRLWEALDDSLADFGGAAGLLADYDTECRKQAEERKAQAAMAEAKHSKEATRVAVVSQAKASAKAKAGVPA